MRRTQRLALSFGRHERVERAVARWWLAEAGAIVQVVIIDDLEHGGIDFAVAGALVSL